MPVNNKTGGEAIDMRLVRKLADVLNETNLTEIEVERGDLKIRVARGGGPAVAAVVPAAPLAYAPDPGAPSRADLPTRPAPEPPVVEPAPTGDIVKSPMVGTVYLQSGPESEVFVTPGAKVTQGQTLLIIEAMKTMNPIAAPRAGVVRQILVDNEQPVEFGEPLVVLE
jgi:acetyl-CoA carboxylase biotin carboxyl carrier protein